MTETDTAALEPCPFCAGRKLKTETKKGALTYKKRGNMSVWQTVSVYVRCQSCNSRGPIATMVRAADGSVLWKDEAVKLKETVEKAHSGWNVRYSKQFVEKE